VIFKWWIAGPSGGVGKKSYVSNLTEISHWAKGFPLAATQFQRHLPIK
jgi:hypothetical protein